MKRDIIDATVVLLAYSVASVASAQTTQNVQLSGAAFTPANITITVGDTVHWIWSSGVHNVESGVIVSGSGQHDGNFRSGDPTGTVGTTYDVVFNQAFLNANPMPGSVYPYYCVVHAFMNMAGSITVQGPDCSGVNNCSGHGTCVAQDTCNCDAGWTGADCGTPTCSGVNNCSNQGTCVDVDTCDCDAGWTGADCSMVACEDVNNCSGHGTCVGPNTCLCEEGFGTDNCSVQVPAVSAWGMVVLGLVILIAAAVVIQRRFKPVEP